MGLGRPPSKHKNCEGQSTKWHYVHPQIYIYKQKQISPILNCVTPDSVSLASYYYHYYYCYYYYYYYCYYYYDGDDDDDYATTLLSCWLHTYLASEESRHKPCVHMLEIPCGDSTIDSRWGQQAKNRHMLHKLTCPRPGHMNTVAMVTRLNNTRGQGRRTQTQDV